MIAPPAARVRTPPPVGPGPADEPTGRLMDVTDRRIGLGHVICWQVCCCLALLSLQRSTPLSVGGAAGAFLLAVATVLPWRGRWMYQWLPVAARYLLRRRGRSIRPGSDATLLDFLVPGAVVHDTTAEGDADEAVAFVSQPAGVTAVLEVRPDDHDFFADRRRPLPNLLTLLPSADAGPVPTCVQLVVVTDGTAVLPGPAGAVTASYRVLSGGEVPVERNCWIAVQALRTPAAFDDPVLRPVLLNLVKRIRRRLREEQLTAVPLTAHQVLTAVSIVTRVDLSHPAGGGVPRETWRGWHSGGRTRTTFRVAGWPERPWSLQLPPVGSTVAVSVLAIADPARAGRDGEVMVESTISLSTADEASLRVGGASLRELVGAAGGALEVLDGRHRSGTAATVPLGRTSPLRRDLSARRGTTRPANVGTLTQLAGGAGLVIGRDRHDEPVIVRVLRSAPTRLVAVGGLGFAQLLVYRLVALGATVHLQTTRPEPWSTFIRRTGVEQGAITFLALGEPPPPATTGRPGVVVVDAGPISGQVVHQQSPWHTTMLVRHDVTSMDTALLAGSDLAFMQPLTTEEAVIAATALRCPPAEPWMSQIGPSMITIIANGTARWATLGLTDIESGIIGSPARLHS